VPSSTLGIRSTFAAAKLDQHDRPETKEKAQQ
jgi:hypothetical protein